MDVLPGARPRTSLLTIPELAQLFQSEGFQGSFAEFLRGKITADIREKIFQQTKQQSLCPIWKQQRLGALTASVLHRAARYTRDDPENYVVQLIMGTTKFCGNSATDYGQKYEVIARKLYEKSMKPKHKHLKVMNSGLMINKDNPLLRASPDALVTCHCCGKGLLEIKCPYTETFKTMTGEEIAQEGKYHLKIGGGKVQLKRTSQWYTQVQTQLAVTQYSWCDFLVFTQKEPHLTIERIKYDQLNFENEYQRALNFYNKFVLPKLLSK